MNGLMLAFAFALPYQVLRTATAAGVRVHVLGSGASRGLRSSRFCASYRRSPFAWNSAPDHDTVLAEIAEIVRRRKIDIIFPSDDVSTRLLAELRHRLPAPVVPLPDPATFDLLNDKWNFSRFARDHAVRVPQAWRCDSADAIRHRIAGGDMALPLTLKPVNRSGGVGVVHIRSRHELDLLDTLDYAPILVQRHIVGEPISISVMCRDGRVMAHTTHQRDQHRFRLVADPDLVRNVKQLVAAAALTGLANFDGVVEAATGLSHIVECNPRFWYSIALTMIVGFNFFDFAVDDAKPRAGEPECLTDGEISLGLKRILFHPRQASSRDWRYFRYRVGDPFAFLAERWKLFDDRLVAVDAGRMSAYMPPPEPYRAAVA